MENSWTFQTKAMEMFLRSWWTWLPFAVKYTVHILCMEVVSLIFLVMNHSNLVFNFVFRTCSFIFMACSSIPNIAVLWVQTIFIYICVVKEVASLQGGFVNWWIKWTCAHVTADQQEKQYSVEFQKLESFSFTMILTSGLEWPTIFLPEPFS